MPNFTFLRSIRGIVLSFFYLFLSFKFSYEFFAARAISSSVRLQLLYNRLCYESFFEFWIFAYIYLSTFFFSFKYDLRLTIFLSSVAVSTRVFSGLGDLAALLMRSCSYSYSSLSRGLTFLRYACFFRSCYLSNLRYYWIYFWSLGLVLTSFCFYFYCWIRSSSFITSILVLWKPWKYLTDFYWFYFFSSYSLSR